MMNIYKHLFAVAAIVAAGSTANAASLPTPTAFPLPTSGLDYYYEEAPTYMAGTINEIILTWEGTTLELTGTGVVKYNAWNTDIDKTVPTASLKVDGPNLIIPVDFSQPDTYEVYIGAGVVKDTKSGNTNALITKKPVYSISPLAITTADVVSNPPRGTALQDLSTITLTIPGWNVDYDPFYKDYITKRVKYCPGIQMMVDDDFISDNMSSVQSVTIANNTITITLPKLTQYGWYTLVVLDGAFLASNDIHSDVTADMNDPIMLYYNYAGYQMYPSDFSTYVGTLDSFNIYSDNIELSGEVAVSEIKVTVSSTEESIPVSSVEPIEDERGKGLAMILSKPLFAGKEEAVLNVPANTFKINGDLYANVIESHVNLRAAMPMAISNPADKATVDALGVITVNWANNTPLSRYMGFMTIQYNDQPATDITDSNFHIDTEYEILEGTDIGSVEVPVSSTLVIDFSKNPYKNPGTYKIFIPAGFVKGIDFVEEYGNTNPAQVLTFFIRDENDPEPNPEITVYTVDPKVSPEEGTVEELNAIVISWGLTIAANEDNTESATLNGENVELSINGQDLNMTLDAAVTGVYTLNVPEGYVLIQDEEGKIYYSQALELAWTLDVNNGVCVIETDAEGYYKVYNLNGVNVLNTDKADMLNTLPKGIYIVNGKKVVI